MISQEEKDRIITEGMVVWEPSCLFDNMVSTTQLHAGSDCELFRVSEKDILKFMEYNPGFLLRLKIGNQKILY